MWYLIGIIIYLGISINIIMVAFEWGFENAWYVEWKGQHLRYKILVILTAPILYVIATIIELFEK